MNVIVNLLLDTLLLFLIGCFGWKIFSFFRFPVPDLLGAMFTVALLRIFIAPISNAPSFFSPFIQICLGLFIGSKVTREKVVYLKELVKPALLIVGWVMLMAFALGGIMARITNVDLITGVLSSTLGGLPEMTVIALETDADATVVVVIKSVRMVSTVALFPIVFERWLTQSNVPRETSQRSVGAEKLRPFCLSLNIHQEYHKLRGHIEAFKPARRSKIFHSFTFGLLSLGISALGGLIFRYMNVPAGAMVGGMFFAIAASLLGFRVRTVPVKAFVFLRVGLGIVLADNITMETFSIFSSGSFLFAVFINTFVVFLTFIFVVYIVHALTGWDYETCFLAAAPAGLTIMTTLALKYNKDSFSISMLHLCRLISIKAIFPFIFMRFM